MLLLKKHWLFLLITSIVLIFLQYTPYLYHRFQTPPDRVYLGAERYTPDYYVYLFYTNQGAMGKTSVQDYYTNAPHDGSWVHIEYLIAGKIGSLFKLSLPATFYFFRTLTLIFYLLVSFWFIGLFFKNTLLHKLTYLLSWFWGGVFWPQISSTGLTFKSYFDFYQPPDLVNRLTFEPHKFIGMGLFLILIYKISQIGQIKQIKPMILILLLLAGFIHGVTAISLIFTIGLYLLFITVINVLNKKSIHEIINLYAPNILIIIILSLPLLYWQLVFTKNPVWYAVSLWERHFAQVDSVAPLLPTITGYLFILGPLIILSLIGLGKFLNEHKKLGILLFSFLLSNLFLFFVGYIFLGTTKHRYYQEPYLVGWSILAMYGLNIIFKKSGKVLVVIAVLLLLGLPNFKQGLNTQLYQFGTPPNLDVWGYPPVGWYQGLLFMKKNTAQNAIILSLPTAGEIIPAIPGRRVVVGDYVHTFHYFDKLPMVTIFFKGNMTENEAKNFLNQEKVNYIFSGPDEKALGDISGYTFLKPVFKNDQVTIYKFAPTPPTP